MKVLYAVIPCVVLGQQYQLYNNANPSTVSCEAKTNPCDCHYASCTTAGVCACGWDTASNRCRAGIETKCASCPAMRRCGRAEPLLLGPDGFPLPGQLSVWGNVPFPDDSPDVVPALPIYDVPPEQLQEQPPLVPQSVATNPIYQTNPLYQSQRTQPLTPRPMAPPVAVTRVPPAAVSTQAPPLTLYQDNMLSATGCAAKTSPCDCHYASCTAAGECICGWDTLTNRCRAGVNTKCESCPAMRRCAVHEKLKIGPDGFPVPGQLSVWGDVPYPDQVQQFGTATPIELGTPMTQEQFNQWSAQWNANATIWNPQVPAPTRPPQNGKGKAGKGGKAGKAGKGASTQAPTTQAPTTQAPTTQAPTTQAPTGKAGKAGKSA